VNCEQDMAVVGEETPPVRPKHHICHRGNLATLEQTSKLAGGATRSAPCW
jgi:hypothetical protein